MADSTIPANIMSTITTVVKAIGGYFVMKGVVSGSLENDIVGVVLVLVPLFYSWFQNHQLLHSPPPVT